MCSKYNIEAIIPRILIQEVVYYVFFTINNSPLIVTDLSKENLLLFLCPPSYYNYVDTSKSVCWNFERDYVNMLCLIGKIHVDDFSL